MASPDDILNIAITLLIPALVMKGRKHWIPSFLKGKGSARLFFDLGVSGVIYALLTFFLNFEVAFLSNDYSVSMGLFINLLFSLAMFVSLVGILLFKKES